MYSDSVSFTTKESFTIQNYTHTTYKMTCTPCVHLGIKVVHTWYNWQTAEHNTTIYTLLYVCIMRLLPGYNVWPMCSLVSHKQKLTQQYPAL